MPLKRTPEFYEKELMKDPRSFDPNDPSNPFVFFFQEDLGDVGGLDYSPAQLIFLHVFSLLDPDSLNRKFTYDQFIEKIKEHFINGRWPLTCDDDPSGDRLKFLLHIYSKPEWKQQLEKNDSFVSFFITCFKYHREKLGYNGNLEAYTNLLCRNYLRLLENPQDNIESLVSDSEDATLADAVVGFLYKEQYYDQVVQFIFNWQSQYQQSPTQYMAGVTKTLFEDDLPLELYRSRFSSVVDTHMGNVDAIRKLYDDSKSSFDPQQSKETILRDKIREYCIPPKSQSAIDIEIGISFFLNLPENIRKDLNLTINVVFEENIKFLVKNTKFDDAKKIFSMFKEPYKLPNELYDYILKSELDYLLSQSMFKEVIDKIDAYQNSKTYEKQFIAHYLTVTRQGKLTNLSLFQGWVAAEAVALQKEVSSSSSSTSTTTRNLEKIVSKAISIAKQKRLLTESEQLMLRPYAAAFGDVVNAFYLYESIYRGEMHQLFIKDMARFEIANLLFLDRIMFSIENSKVVVIEPTEAQLQQRSSVEKAIAMLEYLQNNSDPQAQDLLPRIIDMANDNECRLKADGSKQLSFKAEVQLESWLLKKDPDRNHVCLIELMHKYQKEEAKKQEELQTQVKVQTKKIDALVGTVESQNQAFIKMQEQISRLMTTVAEQAKVIEQIRSEQQDSSPAGQGISQPTLMFRR